MKRSEMVDMIKNTLTDLTNLNEGMARFTAVQIISEQEHVGSILLEDDEPKHEVCFNCCKVVVNGKCCGNPERNEYDPRIKMGSVVRLNQKARDDWYSSYQLFDSHTSSRVSESESFVNYVDEVISFVNGEQDGVVVGYGASNGIARVEYISQLTGEVNHHYYGLEDLTFIGQVPIGG